MASVFLLFLCLFIGIFIQRLPNFPKNTAVVLNQYILYISLPAMALYYLPKVAIGWELLIPASVAWLAFLLSFLFFQLLGKRLGWSKKLIGCLILTAGLGNTSFVGIPVIQAMYGDEGLETLILVDLPGTFMVLSTVGVVVATLYSNQQSGSQKDMVKKILTFPPLMAFVIGFSMALFSLKFPSVVDETFLKIAQTLSPIALISVGFQLKFKSYSKHYPFLALGLAFQLLIFPAILLIVYHYIFGLSDLVTKVCIVEAAMAPMITASIIAQKYGLKPELSSMMVGYGIPISFITLYGWYQLVEFLF